MAAAGQRRPGLAPVTVPAFVLVHSPLASPYTWEPVAREITELGARCTVPTLSLEPDGDGRYWPVHVEQLVRSAYDFESAVVLVAHSGAGPLVPEAAQRLGDGAVGVCFADATLPHPGVSRIRAFGDEDEAARFRGRAEDGLIPPFPPEVFAGQISLDEERAAYSQAARPMPLAIYEEAMPTTTLPGIRSAYLQFSQAYNAAGATARELGWRYRQLPGTHFHMLNSPKDVARAIFTWFEDLPRS